MGILTGNSDSFWLRDDIGLLAMGKGRSIWAVGDILRDDGRGPVLLLRDSLSDDRWWIRRLVDDWSLVLITTLWRSSRAVDSVNWLGNRARAVITTVRYDARLKLKRENYAYQ